MGNPPLPQVAEEHGTLLGPSCFTTGWDVPRRVTILLHTKMAKTETALGGLSSLPSCISVHQAKVMGGMLVSGCLPKII